MATEHVLRRECRSSSQKRSTLSNGMRPFMCTCASFPSLDEHSEMIVRCFLHCTSASLVPWLCSAHHRT